MNKKDLGFIVFWQDRNNKETTWSGTPLSLYNALCNYYNIVECDLSKLTFNSFARKVYSRISNKTFALGEFKINSFYINKVFSKYNRIPAIRFEEGLSRDNVSSYIYQDLCVDYLDKMRRNDPELYAVSGFAHLESKMLSKRLENQRLNYKNSAGIFTMGRWLQKYIIENYDVDKNKVHHIGGGSNVDVSMIDYSEKNGHRILFVGRDFVRKAGSLVVDAFKILKQKFDGDAELYIIGPKENPVKENIKGCNFLGEIPSKDIYKYFNLCDIFVMPSRFEAYGLVFAEALSFGLPAIGRNTCEMPYFIEKGVTGDLIDNDDAAVLAEKMFNLLNNEEIKQNVQSKRDWYISEYSWDTVGRRIYNVIESRDADE